MIGDGWRLQLSGRKGDRGAPQPVSAVPRCGAGVFPGEAGWNESGMESGKPLLRTRGASRERSRKWKRVLRVTSV